MTLSQMLDEWLKAKGAGDEQRCLELHPLILRTATQLEATLERYRQLLKPLLEEGILT